MPDKREFLIIIVSHGDDALFCGDRKDASDIQHPAHDVSLSYVRKLRDMWASTCHDDETGSFRRHKSEHAQSYREK